MTGAQLILLGWTSIVNRSHLSRYHVIFQNRYSLELVQKYIMEGDYSSDIPFGICEEDGQLTLVAQRKPQYIYVHDNPIEILDTGPLPNSMDGLEIYAITSLYQRLSEIGYERPVDVRSFVGRLKGRASLRSSPIFSKKIQHIDSELDFCINRAEHLMGLITADILILYSPRHEISESRFGLSARNLIPQDLVESKYMKRFPQSVLQRFTDLSSSFGIKPTENLQLTPMLPFSANRFNRPSLIIPYQNGEEQVLTNDKMFETIILEHWKPYDCFSVQILVDVTGKSNHIREYVRELKRQFLAITGIESEIHFMDNLDQLEVSSVDGVIVLIDDLTPGYQAVYQTIKTKLQNPSKVVLLSTLINEDIRKTVFALYQSLKVRIKQELHQTIAKKQIEQVMGLSITPLKRGKYLILSGTYIDGRDIRGRRVLLEKDWETGTPTGSQLIQFIKELTMSSSIDEASLVMTNDRINLLRILKELGETEDFALANIQTMDAVILETIAGQYLVPTDGSFIELTNNQSLVVTNGIPEIDEEGIPAPIQIEVHSSGIYETKDILRASYEHTFLHPASLSKPKLPLALHANRMSIPEERLFTDWVLEGVYL